MDFMRLIKSLEELLYEVIVWLVFYPLTLWLCLRYPQRMMDYADTELGDVQSEQYNDTLSPPLFLMSSLAISHGISVALHVDTSSIAQVKLLSTTEHLLIFRVFAFSLLPLAMSLQLMHKLSLKLDRDSLRAPFYSQCFITAPFAMLVGLLLSVSSLLDQSVRPVSLVLITVPFIWYLRQQAHWFAGKLGISLWLGWRYAVLAALAGMFAMTAAALLILGM